MAAQTPRGVIESPVFGHSDTHTLLQLADLVVFSLLFPIACHAYLNDVTWNVHCVDAYQPLRERFGKRLKKLQFRYQDPVGKWRGGIVVSDRRTQRPSSLMFGPPKAPVAASVSLPGPLGLLNDQLLPGPGTGDGLPMTP
ncbi:DUF3800 domain-containing protein [Streptomyces pratens]|uniref:DUF3800 domain-containing protein n=1 Tax=Streptomyces pratens TaxID=887456 RepID=A0ABW1MC23_9ACTN